MGERDNSARATLAPALRVRPGEPDGPAVGDEVEAASFWYLSRKGRLRGAVLLEAEWASEVAEVVDWYEAERTRWSVGREGEGEGPRELELEA